MAHKIKLLLSRMASHLDNVVVWTIAMMGVLLGLSFAEVAHQRVMTAEQMEAAFRTVISNTNPVIVCRDEQILIVNPAAEKLLGIPAKQLNKKPVTNIIGDAYQERHREAMRIVSELPPGSEGYSRYILPIHQKKFLVTIYYRVEASGSTLTIARLLDNTFGKDSPWKDVSDGKWYLARIELEPVDIP